MKFTQIAADAFKKLQMNAGVILSDFDPSVGTIDRTKIVMATGGGVNFSAVAEFVDFGDDIDNVPANTMELKRQKSVAVTMSGTAKTVDTATAKMFMAAADIDESTGKVTPRADLYISDFTDLWWVGDYSDVNSGADAGFLAIHMLNVLNTGGLSLQSNDDGKGDFAFTFTAHYSMADTTVVPYELYVSGSADVTTAQLSSLTVGSLALSPTFAPSTRNYTCTTTAASNVVTAVAADSDATIGILNGDDEVTNGGSATWVSGENVLVITVANDDARIAYTVTVTKE